MKQRVTYRVFVPLALAAACAMALMAGGCGKRYVEGTTPQQAVAFEFDEGLTQLRAAQERVIAAVDADPSIKPTADKFLNPVRDAFVFARDEVVPRLEAFDAAMKLGDEVKTLTLQSELNPLLQKFESLVLGAFGVQLPPELSSSISGFADEVKRVVAELRARFEQ